MLIEEKPVFFITAVGPPLASSASKFLREVTVCSYILDGIINKDIVKPELGLIIANRLLALETVCNIDIRKTVVVEIERTATPGPAGVGDGTVHGRLFEATVGSP